MSEVNSHISVKGHWYATVPIAIINKNAAIQKPVPFCINGQDIVIWKSRNGEFIAQEDRCAHVDAELNTGICGEDFLVCAHHGWTHHPDGHARPPGALNWKTPNKGWRKIKTYKTTERLGVLWIWSMADSEGDSFNCP